MAWSAKEACASLAKGWRKRGMPKDKIAVSQAKCERHWKAPRRKRGKPSKA